MDVLIVGFFYPNGEEGIFTLGSWGLGGKDWTDEIESSLLVT